MEIDWLALWYRWIEYAAFGRALERARFEFVERLRDSARILVLGEGDGRMLRRMLDAAPGAEFVVVEGSAAMIQLARARVSDERRVHFIHARATANALHGLGNFDAVVTCFFLDCLAEAEARRLIQVAAAGLTPNGVWLMTDFAVPSQGWRRLHARMWVATMYRFFRLATGLQVRVLPPIDVLLAEAGLANRAETKARAGLIVSQLWQKN